MRKYQQIWERLKQKQEAYITAPEEVHASIKKAVIKEKYQDINFKFECSQLSKRAKLIIQIKGTIIKFTLHYSIGVDDL